jgi:hypothetical protein
MCFPCMQHRGLDKKGVETQQSQSVHDKAAHLGIEQVILYPGLVGEGREDPLVNEASGSSVMCRQPATARGAVTCTCSLKEGTARKKA